MKVNLDYKNGKCIRLENVVSFRKNDKDNEIMFGFIVRELFHETPFKMSDLESVTITKF